MRDCKENRGDKKFVFEHNAGNPSGSPTIFWFDPFGELLAKKLNPLGKFWFPSDDIKKFEFPIEI